MKKVLLSCVAFFTVLSSFAQDAALPNGYHPEASGPYAKDYFMTTTEYGTANAGGVYWWTQTKTGAKLDTTVTKNLQLVGFTCDKDTSYFKYHTTRPGDGTLNYTIWQPYGKYEPVGVGFGVTHTGTDSVVKTLDVSKGAFVSVNFTNTTDPITGTDFTVKILLQDANGATLNSVGPNTAGDTYKDEILFHVPAGSSQVISQEFVASKLGDVAYYANYPLDSCEEGGTPVHETNFDYTKCVAVMFTIVDDAQIADDGYKHPALGAATFTLKEFFVGDKSAVVGLADNFLAKPSFKIYPNPVSNVNGVVNFEKEVKEVKVVNSVGQVVFTAPSASSLSTNNFTKGMYVIQSTTGNARFVVE